MSAADGQTPLATHPALDAGSPVAAIARVTPKSASAGCGRDRALRPGNGTIVDCRGVIPRRARPAADFNGRGDRQEKKISESGPPAGAGFAGVATRLYTNSRSNTP
jgi:hypothetical protein